MLIRVRLPSATLMDLRRHGGEKRISVDSSSPATNDTRGPSDPPAPSTRTEYRVWNPSCSGLAAGVLGGASTISNMRPNSRVLYLGAASGTSISYVSNIADPTSIVYTVELSHCSGSSLISMVIKRPNVIPIIEDTRYLLRYRMLVSIVDCVFADVAQLD